MKSLTVLPEVKKGSSYVTDQNKPAYKNQPGRVTSYTSSKSIIECIMEMIRQLDHSDILNL